MAHAYRKSGIKVEIIIRDELFRKIDVWKFTKNEASKYGKILKKKYGIDFVHKERDLSWINK